MISVWLVQFGLLQLENEVHFPPTSTNRKEIAD